MLPVSKILKTGTYWPPLSPPTRTCRFHGTVEAVYSAVRVALEDSILDKIAAFGSHWVPRPGRASLF